MAVADTGARIRVTHGRMMGSGGGGGGEANTTLRIAAAQLDDTGVYTCVAANELDSDRREARVVVQGDTGCNKKYNVQFNDVCIATVTYLNWLLNSYEAEGKCVDMKGHLLTIRSKQMQAFVVGLFNDSQKTKDHIIGGRRNNTRDVHWNDNPDIFVWNIELDDYFDWNNKKLLYLNNLYELAWHKLEMPYTCLVMSSRSRKDYWNGEWYRIDCDTNRSNSFICGTKSRCDQKCDGTYTTCNQHTRKCVSVCGPWQHYNKTDKTCVTSMCHGNNRLQCHENAICAPVGNNVNTAYCQCLDNYEGDGVYRCILSVPNEYHTKWDDCESDEEITTSRCDGKLKCQVLVKLNRYKEEMQRTKTFRCTPGQQCLNAHDHPFCNGHRVCGGIYKFLCNLTCGFCKKDLESTRSVNTKTACSPACKQGYRCDGRVHLCVRRCTGLTLFDGTECIRASCHERQFRRWDCYRFNASCVFAARGILLGFCKCNKGFYGDGLNCTKVGAPGCNKNYTHRFKNMCIAVMHTKLNHDEAESKCVAMKGQLLTIHSKQMQTYIDNLLSRKGNWTFRGKVDRFVCGTKSQCDQVCDETWEKCDPATRKCISVCGRGRHYRDGFCVLSVCDNRNLSLCHKYADCKLTTSAVGFCQCRENYQGDGVNRCIRYESYATPETKVASLTRIYRIR